MSRLTKKQIESAITRYLNPMRNYHQTEFCFELDEAIEIFFPEKSDWKWPVTEKELQALAEGVVTQVFSDRYAVTISDWDSDIDGHFVTGFAVSIKALPLRILK